MKQEMTGWQWHECGKKQYKNKRNQKLHCVK